MTVYALTSSLSRDGHVKFDVENNADVYADAEDDCDGDGYGDGDGDSDGFDLFDDGCDQCVMMMVSDFVDDKNVTCFPLTT